MSRPGVRGRLQRTQVPITSTLFSCPQIEEVEAVMMVVLRCGGREGDYKGGPCFLELSLSLSPLFHYSHCGVRLFMGEAIVVVGEPNEVSESRLKGDVCFQVSEKNRV